VPGGLTGKQRDRLAKESGAPTRNPIVELQAADIERMFVRSPENTIDVRGFRVDDALAAVDKFLDTAFVGEEPQVMIIHGMGTSALRKAIRDAIARHPQVKKSRSGDRDEGGDGVTIIDMA